MNKIRLIHVNIKSDAWDVSCVSVTVFFYFLVDASNYYFEKACSILIDYFSCLYESIFFHIVIVLHYSRMIEMGSIYYAVILPAAKPRVAKSLRMLLLLFVISK